MAQVGRIAFLSNADDSPFVTAVLSAKGHLPLAGRSAGLVLVRERSLAAGAGHRQGAAGGTGRSTWMT
jgi:hypothetical protein